MTLTITPSRLADALDLAPAGVEVLSLDCFDTLLWRGTHRPRDVFADLPNCTTQQRMLAESTARRRAAVNDRTEVGIEEIYRTLAPTASDGEIAERIAAELAAEARHCFAFAPTVELMRRAKARGLKVIVVSDTYLDASMLRNLIRTAAGEDVSALIDTIFVSSEHGMPKSAGLFRPVLKALKFPAARVLHIGDNLKADSKAPLELGMHAIHLEQFDADTEQRLRLEAAAAVLLSGRATGCAPVMQPHRAQLMLGGHAATDAVSALGYGTLGPILRAYTGWLRAEVNELATRTTGRVHVLFLMRDGHLPRLAYDLNGAESHAVEISRYTAIAASLTDDDALLRYVEPRLTEQAVEVLGRQLLLTPAEIDELAGLGPTGRRKTRFATEVRRTRTLRKIAARCDAFAGRLADYIRAVVNPAPGDTLVLADLGYNGTVQTHVEPVLRARLGVEVAGRYLVCHPDDVSGCDKGGLIDARHFEPAALSALCQYISVLEQLCTAPTGSVVDYQGGAPVRTANDIKGAQSAVRDTVQQAGLAYVREHGSGFHTHAASCDADGEREAAAATLARLLFLPMPAELEVLRGFEHDVNLGTSQTLGLFDPAAATEGLRHWGLFYMNTAKRMFLSAELRDAGMPLSLTLLANARFGLDLRQKDFSHGGMQLPIMVADATGVADHLIEARPTHDGFYAAMIPIGPCRYAIGVQFGRLYEWAQLEAVQFLPETDLPTEFRTTMPQTTPATPVFDGIQAHAGGMLQCESEAGFMLIPPPRRVDDRSMVLAVVFRPLVARKAEDVNAHPALLAAE